MTKDKIKPGEVKVAQLNENRPLIIDVRSTEEYETEHIEGAVHIPIDDLSHHLSGLDQDQLIVTYCTMKHPGASRGERASEYLREHGYDARTLDGGLPAWQGADMPVATGSEAKLDDQ